MDVKELELLYNKKSPLYNDVALKNLIYETLRKENLINVKPNPAESQTCDNTVLCLENSTRKRKQTCVKQSQNQDLKGKCKSKKKGKEHSTKEKEVAALDDPQRGFEDEDLSHNMTHSVNLSECAINSDLKSTIKTDSKLQSEIDATSHSVAMATKTPTSSANLPSHSHNSVQDNFLKMNSVSLASVTFKNSPQISSEENEIRQGLTDDLSRVLPNCSLASNNTSLHSNSSFEQSNSSCSVASTCRTESMKVLESLPNIKPVCDVTQNGKNVSFCKLEKSNSNKSLTTKEDLVKMHPDKVASSCPLRGACLPNSCEPANTKISEKIGAMVMVESKLETSCKLNSNLGGLHGKNTVLETSHIVKSKHGTECAMESKHGTACAMESKHGTAYAMESKHGTAYAMESKHGMAYALESKHGTACTMESKQGTACAMESKHGTACAMESKHGTACAMESKHGITGAVESKHGKAYAMESKHVTTGAMESNNGKMVAMESKHGIINQKGSMPNCVGKNGLMCEKKNSEKRLSEVINSDEINSIVAILVKANDVFKEFPKNGDSEKMLLMQKQNEFLEETKLKNADPDTLAKHKLETRRRLLECTVEYIEMRITQAVKFAKKIPGFVQLPLDDQVNLVKESRTESGIIGGMRGINARNQVFSSHNGYFFTLQDMRLVFSQNLLQQTMTLSRKIAALDLSPAEEALLRAITITASDRCPLSSILQVEEIQRKILTCLEHVITSNGQTPAGPRLGKLIDILINCRDVTEVDMKEVKGILLEWPSFSKYKLVEEFL